jgi:hypothetical protein
LLTRLATLSQLTYNRASYQNNPDEKDYESTDRRDLRIEQSVSAVNRIDAKVRQKPPANQEKQSDADQNRAREKPAN